MGALRFAPLLLMLTAHLGQAQEVDRLHTGALNLDLTFGRSFGTVASARGDPLEFANRSGISGRGGIAAGAAIGVSLNLSVLFISEVSYIEGGRREYQFGGGFVGESLTRAWLYEAGVQFRFRTKSDRLVPYVAGGLSTVQVRANLLVNFVPLEPPAPDTLAGGATDLRVHQATFAPLAGVGFRYYISDSFGVRSELKGYFPTGGVKEPFGRFVGGVFFQLR